MNNLPRSSARAVAARSPHPFVLPDAAQVEVPKRVLLAFFEGERPTVSLLRAHMLSCLFEAELHVVCVLPIPRRFEARMEPGHVDDMFKSVAQTLEASKATRRWLHAVLGDALPPERIALVRGAFVEQVAIRASVVGARLLLVPPSDQTYGAVVTSLACESGLPVWVAHEVAGEATILAATSLEHVGYPVLQKALEIGRHLSAPVLAVHNVAGERRNRYGPLFTPRRERLRSERRQLFASAATGCRLEDRPLLTEQRSPVDAILKTAREQDADLVVVGTKVRRWFKRGSRDVAAQVVNRAQRSVLVTPVA